MPPHSTKRRITPNLKTISNQNCQKIKLHETLTTKELKKHSFRPIGGAKTGNQAERTQGKMTDFVGKAGMAGWETTDSKPLAVKHCGGCKARRNFQSHSTVCWNVGLEWSE